MKNFLTRLVSGVTVAALIIAGILASRISYGIIVLIAAVGGIFEFYTISAPIRHADEADNKKSRRLAVILTVLAIFFSWLLNFQRNFAEHKKLMLEFCRTPCSGISIPAFRTEH